MIIEITQQGQVDTINSQGGLVASVPKLCKADAMFRAAAGLAFPLERGVCRKRLDISLVAASSRVKAMRLRAPDVNSKPKPACTCSSACRKGCKQASVEVVDGLLWGGPKAARCGHNHHMT